MANSSETNNGKHGGLLKGKRHYDKNGQPLGGIKAIVTDAGGKPVELEGGEVIINREASKKHWKQLSEINQSAGNGVPIGPPSSVDDDPEDYKDGGKIIDFNPNHVPSRNILGYAKRLKKSHPEIWKLGGNIFGNEAFENLKRVAERGYWLESEEWMYIKWRSYVARHIHDFRIEGVVAMLKWVDKVEKGWPYMKNLIEEEIKKREARKSKKMNDGGNVGAKKIAQMQTITYTDKDFIQEFNLYDSLIAKNSGMSEAAKNEKDLILLRLPFTTWYLELKKGENTFQFLGNTYELFSKSTKLVATTYRQRNFHETRWGIKTLQTTNENTHLNKYGVITNENSNPGSETKEKLISAINYNFQKLILRKQLDVTMPGDKMRNGGSVGNVVKKGYHGTQKKSPSEIKPTSGRYGFGIYLTPDYKTAEYFGKQGFVNGFRQLDVYSNANVYEYDLSNLKIQKLQSSDEIDNLDKATNYDGIYLEDEGEIIIYNTNKLKDGKLKTKMRNGGNLSKTPAPASERIKGSKFNASGSAKDSTSGENIEFDDNTLTSIKLLIDSHNEKYPNKKITLGVAKAVVRRGMGAYSSSHRPTITDGKPNSRVAWGLARLKAFLFKAKVGKSKSGKYSQDNDLFDDLDIKVSKYADGGLIAPNGKPSNLTPEQYKLVRTPEFKNWFGDWENDPANSSRVVDENGEPLVVYRGDSSASKKGFVFKTGFNRMGFINNKRMPNQYFHYFINQSEIAKKYAENQVEYHNDKVEETGKGKLWTPEVTPYFLNIRNYIDITPANSSFPTFEEFKREFKNSYGDFGVYEIPYHYGFDVSKKDLYKIFQQKLGKDYLDNQPKWDYIKDWTIEQYKTEEKLEPTYSFFIEFKQSYNQSDVLRRVYYKMLEQNVDGLLFLENTHWDDGFWKNWRDYESGKLKYDYKNWVNKPKVFAALESNQIKLADGTNVTFDSSNDDIRFEDGGGVTSMSWYTNFKKQQLKKGIKAEYEHAKTIAKFKRKNVSIRDVASGIAEDHLKEDPNYYSQLEKMEAKFVSGGKLNKEILSSEFYDKGGNIDFDKIQPLDKDGTPKIDDKSLKILTERVLKLPQTKELNTDENGNYLAERKRLHKEIINEFKQQAVCITKGQPIAILMGGSPASGKSSFIRKYRPYLMVNDIVKVDADEIRAKLPEYRGFNATQTHLETKDIVNTLISDRNIGVPCNFDMIYDGTMNSVKSYEPLIALLKQRNYQIFIIYIDKVPYKTVVQRMKERYKKSGRFVPVEVIDDFFSKGKEALERLKKQVDGYVIVDGSNFDYDIIERGGKELPQERDHKFLGKKIDQKSLDKIQYKRGGGIDSNSGGDCYVIAGDFVIGNRFTDGISFNGEPFLVHAQVTGQGKIQGLKYGHAWIEDDEMVYDFSNGRKLIVPREIYYLLGKITTEPPIYFKYYFSEAKDKMLENGHYGPWDLQTESGL